MNNLVMTRRAILTVVSVVAGGAVAGCQTTQASAVSSSGDMSPSDLEFVTNAFNIIEFDRLECSLAQTQARSPEVRTLAARLLEQANDFSARLLPVAAEAGIKPPTVLRVDLRVRAGRLRLAQGLDFDRSFVEDQILSHQDSLDLESMVMSTAGSNAKLQELSRQGNEIVARNLAELRTLQRQMIMRG